MLVAPRLQLRAVEPAHREAFALPAVCATTLAQRNPSNSVLRKLGMRFSGESQHPAPGGTWRWTRSRADHHRVRG